MFVADRLIYLQLQKTGCSHITRLLRQTVGGEQIGKHNRLPEDLAVDNRLVIGSVRNPWEWYVSLWAFGTAGKGDLFNALTTRRFVKRLRSAVRSPVRAVAALMQDFAKPVRRWRESYGGDQPACFRLWLTMLFDRRRANDLGEGYGMSAVADNAGLMTYRYLALYARDASQLNDRHVLGSFRDIEAFDREQNILDYAIRTEALESDLLKVLAAAGYVIDSRQTAAIENAGKFNSSQHREAAYYYDRETAALVARKERLLIEKYGYLPPTV